MTPKQRKPAGRPTPVQEQIAEADAEMKRPVSPAEMFGLHAPITLDGKTFQAPQFDMFDMLALRQAFGQWAEGDGGTEPGGLHDLNLDDPKTQILLYWIVARREDERVTDADRAAVPPRYRMTWQEAVKTLSPHLLLSGELLAFAFKVVARSRIFGNIDGTDKADKDAEQSGSGEGDSKNDGGADGK